MKIRFLNICFSADLFTPSGSFPGRGGKAIKLFRKIFAFPEKTVKRSIVPVLLLCGLIGAGETVALAPGFAETLSGCGKKRCSALQVSNVRDHRFKSAPLKGDIHTAVPFSGEKSERIEAPVQDILHASDLKQLQRLIKKGEERAFEKRLCEKQLRLKAPPDSCYGFPDLRDRADTHCLNLKIQNVSLSSLSKALKTRRLSAICRRRLEFFKKILLYRQKDALLKKPPIP